MNKQEKAERAKKHYRLMLQLFPEEIEYSIENSKIYESNDVIDVSSRGFDTEIILEDNDTISALYDHINGKTCVLNFASYKNPGGGYLTGSTTQEEMLCAESTLFPVLLDFKDTYYKENKETSNMCLYTSRAIYSKDVVFTRNSRFIKADVLTIAAPNLRLRDKLDLKQEKIDIELKDRIDKIFKIASNNNVDTLILGAFGCGAFKNDPKQVATYFSDWLKDNPGVFKKVIFAIPAGPNYYAFSEIIK